MKSWKKRLGDRVDAVMAREIEIFEMQLQLRSEEKVDEKIFAETRLRRGVYGQRYDNGQRHDGLQARQLVYTDRPTKGPNTLWDAPGMQRIKIPYGGLTAEQMDVIGELAEEYSDQIVHITTRQDVQLHFIHIDDTPDIMRRLASVGISTREACGNVVRNVCACPMSGVCSGEAFDVTPFSDALATFLLGHPDAQDFGRKFKVSFSGCSDQACGLAHMHDLGFVASVRTKDGATERGFALYVGGGLGAVPHQAKLFDEFVPIAEILPLSQAVCRVFARLGEKKSRGKARMKFLIAKLGIEAFRELVVEERKILPADARWLELIDRASGWAERPIAKPRLVQLGTGSDAFKLWRNHNVEAQKQDGYFVVSIPLPLGDLTADQMRGLADVAREFTGDTIRTTVEQNILLRHAVEADLQAIHRALDTIGLAEPVANTIVDVTTCPGTDTCKLGISASRGLATELRSRLAAQSLQIDEAIRGLRIKVSGCFNSCGQHHVSDIGFYGVSRKKNGHQVPHFQVVLGGEWGNNAGSFGLATGAVPSRNIPEVVDRITGMFVDARSPGESFQSFVARVGKAEIKKRIWDLTEVPAYQDDPSFYSDWGDPREFTMDDHGVGECAGEVVSLAEFGLHASERQVFEAQLQLDAADHSSATDTAYLAMITAAKALVETEFIDVGDEPTRVVEEFRSRFYDTQRIFDPFAKGKFARYLFNAHDARTTSPTKDRARQAIEEAQLFIENAHACYERMSS